jgi:hypothetical protein
MWYRVYACTNFVPSLFSEATMNMSHGLQELSSTVEAAAYGVFIGAGSHHVPNGFVHPAVELTGLVV